MEHVETGTFASSFLRPAKLPKLDWKTCLCHSGPVSSHEPLVEWPLAEPAIMEDSAGSTPPAIVTIVYMLIFVTVVLDWMLLVDFTTEFAIKSILTGNILPD